jgi:hypothetical protein
MRFTHQKVDLQNGRDEHSDAIGGVRKDNYVGATTKDFAGINKSPFGRDQVKYTNSGGYYGQGGFIHYFKSDLSADQASTYYDELVEDGIFDSNFMALTVEVRVF